MPYVTAEELAAEIESNVVSTLALTQLYGEVVEAVSTAIDNHCLRSFVEPAEATERFYVPDRTLCRVADLDDIANTDDLAVAVDSSDSGTFTSLGSTEWFAKSDNATGLVTEIRSTGYFPTSAYGRNTIRVTANFGWPATPDPVKRAAMIWAIRLVNRRSSPTGIVGFGEYGGVKLSTIDPDVKSLLAPYRRRSRLLR